MTTPEGGNCGEVGDYLGWKEMTWTLYGQAVIEKIPIDEPCKVDPTIYVYYTEFANWNDCRHHCQNMGGRIPKITTLEEKQNIDKFLKEFYASVSVKLGGYWLALRDDEEKGIWKDYYTNEMIEYNGSFTGEWPMGLQGWHCLWETPRGEWFDNPCSAPGYGIVCICEHEARPILNSRGICTSSRIGKSFIPYESGQDRGKLQYIRKG